MHRKRLGTTELFGTSISGKSVTFLASFETVTVLLALGFQCISRSSTNCSSVLVKIYAMT